MTFRKNRILFLCLVFILLSFPTLAEKPVPLTLEKIAAVGADNHDFMFYSIDSVCEDGSADFYVLDRKACKVHKFSPEGKRLLAFGNRGRGPGDFAYPYYICVTEDKRLAVCEDMVFVSFFNTDGKFLEQIRLSNGLALQYISRNLYYAWIWQPESRQQVLLDNTGSILKSFFEVSRDAFSVSAPDETGRLVMTSFSTEEYTPTLLFGSYNRQAALGISSRYEIVIVNHKGEVVNTIKHDVKPLKIQAKESDYFKSLIDNRRNLHDFAKKKFIKKIPETKNYFDRILLTGEYVFVSRIRADITDEKGPVPVDIFSLGGEFLGTVEMKERPLFISDRYAYFMETVDESLLLIKYKIGIRQ
jgi:hypothetical protein